jgi:hypothetical protein
VNPEIQNSPIKGILTIKQVAAYTIAVLAIAGLYYNMMERVKDARIKSEENNAILQEIRQDRKEDERIFNVRITYIENRQRGDQIRLTILETKLK